MTPLLIVLIVILSVLVLLIIVYLIIGIFMFKMSFGRKDPAKEENKRTVNDPTMSLIEDPEFVNSHTYEEVFITSNDGLKLAAKRLMNPIKSNKYVIFFHGYRGSVMNEWAPSAHVFFDKGYNLYFVEERGNWNSEGKYFTMGPKESEDALLWINYLVAQDKDSKILVFGHLMGAHVVLLTLKYDLPQNVKCIIADCGYDSLDTQLRHVAKDMMKLPCANLLVSIGETYASIFHKMSFNETVTKAVAKNMLPVCLIHGTNDQFVPFFNEEKIANAFSSDCYVEHYAFEGAAHCCSEAKDTKRFHKIIVDFADKFIK